MFQAMASIFAVEYLRLRMFEGQRDKNFRFRRQRIGFNMCAQLSVFDFHG